MESFKLSIIMPVYNETRTLHKILARVVRTPLRKELIIVDDGSTDGTVEILRDTSSLKQTLSQEAEADFELKILFHERNKGKGSAIRTAIPAITGDIALIQDADLEYDPSEYPLLISPILEGRADVVYGSRFMGSPRRVLFFWHMVGNQFLTLLSNMLTNLNLTDMEVGYKVFRTDVLKQITLRSNRFDFEPEVTARIAHGGFRIYEVPVSYAGRTYAEGKKINWKDGFHALQAIVRYNLIDVEAKTLLNPTPAPASLQPATSELSQIKLFVGRQDDSSRTKPLETLADS
jgi:glycosyltransferase involved in cell wall biosynthesis